MSLLRSPVKTANLNSVLGTIPSSNPAFSQYISSVLSPTLPITSANCNTQIGFIVPIASLYSYLGYQLLDGQILTTATINSLASAGNTTVNLRTLSTCTSPSGVCQACLSTEGLSGAVGTSIKIPVSGTQLPAYINALALTYSGSLLGLTPLPAQPPLPVRRALYQLVLNSTLQQRFLSQINVDPTTRSYIEQIDDLLEQFLVMAVMYCANGN